MIKTHTQSSLLIGLDITQTDQPFVKPQSSQTFTPEHNIKNQQMSQQTIIKHPTKPVTPNIKPSKPLSWITKNKKIQQQTTQETQNGDKDILIGSTHKKNSWTIHP